MKFSIVVPVYNVEKYIDKCLSSIKNQTYKNFEVIIVNDGTLDKSQDIIDKYTKDDNRFRSFKKINGGLSDARNYGVKKCTGDYLIFIDSDDYIESSYLLKLKDCIGKNKDLEVIKIKIRLVDENGKIIRNENGFNKSNFVTFDELVSLEFFEPAWSYIYNLKFWRDNKFSYIKGKIHEDFGLTPEILMKANKIFYLNYYAYYYVQRENSIMSSNSKEKLIKKAEDMLFQYDRLINIKYNKDDRVYKSFLSNALISKSKTLNKKDKHNFINKLKKRKVLNDLLDDTFKRKMKKMYYKIIWGVYL